MPIKNNKEPRLLKRLSFLLLELIGKPYDEVRNYEVILSPDFPSRKSEKGNLQ